MTSIPTEDTDVSTEKTDAPIKNTSICTKPCNWTAWILGVLLVGSLAVNALTLYRGIDMHSDIWGQNEKHEGKGEKKGPKMGHDMHDMAGMSMENMSMGSMSMDDMAKMLEGKTGSGIDRAFLEGMIPHHQGAVDMARYLTGAVHAELRQMGIDIISGQSKEIAQMQKWQKEWGYIVGTGAVSIENTGACTREYMPVCGETPVQCIAAPCSPVRITYPNACTAKVAGASNISTGACTSVYPTYTGAIYTGSVYTGSTVHTMVDTGVDAEKAMREHCVTMPTMAGCEKYR